MGSLSKLVLLAIFIFALFAGAILVIYQNQSTSDSEIKIGAVLPFTGSSGITGEASRRGIDLAVFEINQAGGINGKKMNVLYEDSQTKTEVGLTAFQKLLEVNKIRYAFTSVSGVALAVASLANKNEIVQMDVVSATPAYSTPNDFTFRTGINSYYFGKVLSKLLIDRNIQFVSLFYINSDYGVGYKEAFLNDFKKRGGKVDLEVSYNQGDADFRSEISLLQNSDSNSIILISLQKETPLILKQMDEIGFDKNIFTDVYAAELKENLGLKTVKLIEYLKPAIDFAKPNSAAEKFAVNFNIAYGIAPDFISAQAYDGAKMLFLAMKSCQDIDDSNCVKDELYKIRNYSGAIGDGVSFDINGDIIGRKIVAMRIIDGKFVEAN